ncbi:hypothetical protein CHS0354_001579 [Potamilus streckersoni]|uniref:Phosphatidylinositol-4,5-bisphosphate 3-kinase n=1 Tax=Potamilus streckersoni TaxID=2493646 RepID=A0AAE0SIB1_9BIVA|nr:hypothetical protein CHS0354_001579 [Potamilus streckersoni]
MLKETYDFLMPNGMLIPLQLLTDTRLDIVKARLFEEAKKYPAYDLLGKGHQYVFEGVTLEAEIEEFREENLKLLDLPLYLPILTLTMPKQQKQSLQMRHDIGKVMGISVDYIETIKSSEIQDFRRDVGSMCEEVALERQSLPEMKRLLFYYPPILDMNPDLPMHVADIMKKKPFQIKVYIYNPGEEMEKYDVQIDASWTPSRVIHEIIFQKYTRRGEEKQIAKGRALRGEQLYVLKSCTNEEYMFKECCFHSYKYIRHCITWDTIPSLTLVFLDDLLQSIPKEVGSPIEEDDLELQSLSEMERLLISYPPVLDVNQDLPNDDIFEAKKLKTKVYLENPGEDLLIYDIEKYLQKGDEKQLAEKRAFKGEQLYVLKTCRIEEYMLKECCLHSYKYIRHCITWNKTPELTVALLCELLKSIPRILRRSSIKGPRIEPGIGNTISSWDLDGILRIKVDNVTGKRAPPHTELRTMNVVAGIYHGSTLLCKTVSTAKHGWHQVMTFDIRLPDLPRSAKLCLSLCTSKKTVEYWVNIQLFDHKGRLETGQQRLPMWPGTEAISLKRETVPLGMTGCNPDGTFPTLEMEIISPSDKPIMFPSDEHILELIRQHRQRKVSLTTDEMQKNMETMSVKDIDTMLGSDILVKIKKHDRDYIWQNREICLTKPKSLPKLLTTLDWSKRTDVFEFYKLLSMWPKKEVNQLTALQLLDARFPDPRVEQFAVECLGRHFTDEKLLLNLMQLTQALKFRSYIDGPLTRFLLRRSLLNRRVGKEFFWHLRSELHSGSIRLRFAPILEIYCRKCGPILHEHLKEVEVLNFSCRLAKEIKSRNEDPEVGVNYLREQLKNNDEANVLTDAPPIVGRPQQLGKICPEKCGVFRSKMRPLRLTWNNPSPFAEVVRAENFSYIFKHGDDIRQDMLCIQLLQVIDTIWKYEGLDCCLTPYGCLSMGHEIGMIEMVQNSKTIANIHSERGTLLSATGLNGWLHENNRNGYEKAVKRFTHSCAGYAVATFVLGISDRHSDNIMVKNNGELFHIDFGHFLGNRKTKFGIKRERVPFVMTDDFIQVITKGVKKRDESENYKEFVLLCIKAYMALWKNADLLITPLYLMRNSGLPELTKSEDIQFVRQALAVDKDEIKAASYFLDNLKKAILGNWTIKVDWIFHAINQYKRS